LQRFISRDPIGLRGGANLYEYAENAPGSFVDPFGLLVHSGHQGVQEIIDEMRLDWTINRWIFALESRGIDLEVVVDELREDRDAEYDPNCKRITLNKRLFLLRKKKWWRTWIKSHLLHELIHSVQHIVRMPRFGQPDFMKESVTISGLPGTFPRYVNTETEAWTESLNYIRRELEATGDYGGAVIEFAELNPDPAGPAINTLKMIKGTTKRAKIVEHLQQVYGKDYP